MTGKRFTAEEEAKLRQLWEGGVSAALAAKQLKRSPTIVLRRYKMLADENSAHRNGNGAGENVSEAKYEWKQVAGKVTIDKEARDLLLFNASRVKELRASNEALARRNRELLRTIKIIQAAAAVDFEPEDPF